MKLTHFIFIPACLIAVLAIAGCGGGGGSSSAPTPITQVTGIFVDARVSGLTYSCSPSGISDLTTAQGEYTCTSGDDVTFSIGRATLGTIAAQSGIITPYDLFPNNTNAAVNIARLLQTIDSDPNDNVITPNATLVSAIPENLNFSANGTTFENIIMDAFADVDPSVVLISAEVAQAAMNASIVAEGKTVPEVGHAPIANAGVNQNVVVGATVTISGASSSDFDGDPLSYIWSFQEKPPGSNASLSTFDVNVSFVADIAGAYVVQLVVNDGSQDSAADTVTIAANAIPVANAGVDQDVDTNALVTLDGTSSADPTNDPLTYTWTLTVPSGSSAELSDATAIQPTFTTDVEGDYVATLIVDDGFVESDPDTVTIVATTPPSVINGFSPGWMNGRVLYIVILDTEDDDNDGSTTDWLIVGMKFEAGTVTYDFSADGTYEVSGLPYEIQNGVLVRYDDPEVETDTVTAVDDIKITVLHTLTGDPDSTEYLFYERADAQAYMDQLNEPSVENGFSPGWINGRVLYVVGIDTEDDDNDGSTEDYFIVGIKFENGIASYDFSADGIYEVTGISYEIINGVLFRYDGLEEETDTITAVDPIKITVLHTLTGDPDSTEYLFYERADAQAYMDQLNEPSVENGFTADWIDGRVLYIVILDTEDDDNDGSTTDWLIVGMKFEGGTVTYDFSADGAHELSGLPYEIINGVLVITDGAEQESRTITAVDDVKITTNWSVTWGDPDTTEYLFYEKDDAQAYLETL